MAMIRWVLVFAAITLGCGFDFYLVRHGARAPLEGDEHTLKQVFGAGR